MESNPETFSLESFHCDASYENVSFSTKLKYEKKKYIYNIKSYNAIMNLALKKSP